MLKKFVKYLVLSSIIVSLMGCACLKPKYVKKRETAYLSSCEYPPLRVTGCLSGANIGDDFQIPSVAGPRPTCPVDITPPR